MLRVGDEAADAWELLVQKIYVFPSYSINFHASQRTAKRNVMDIDESATTRYTTKAYDTHKHSAIAQLEQIKPLQRFAPSSTNSQP